MFEQWQNFTELGDQESWERHHHDDYKTFLTLATECERRMPQPGRKSQ